MGVGCVICVVSVLHFHFIITTFLVTVTVATASELLLLRTSSK